MNGHWNVVMQNVSSIRIFGIKPTDDVLIDLYMQILCVVFMHNACT